MVLTAYNFALNIEEMNAAIEKAVDAGLGIIAMKTMAGRYLDPDGQRPVNAKAALKWALQNQNVHTSIPGFTAFDQLEESFAIMENPELTGEEKNILRRTKTWLPSFASAAGTALTNARKTCPYRT